METLIYRDFSPLRFPQAILQGACALQYCASGNPHGRIVRHGAPWHAFPRSGFPLAPFSLREKGASGKRNFMKRSKSAFPNRNRRQSLEYRLDIAPNCTLRLRIGNASPDGFAEKPWRSIPEKTERAGNLHKPDTKAMTKNEIKNKLRMFRDEGGDDALLPAALLDLIESQEALQKEHEELKKTVASVTEAQNGAKEEVVASLKAVQESQERLRKGQDDLQQALASMVETAQQTQLEAKTEVLASLKVVQKSLEALQKDQGELKQAVDLLVEGQQANRKAQRESAKNTDKIKKALYVILGAIAAAFVFAALVFGKEVVPR